VRLTAREELLRVGQPTLPPSQLAQPRERVADHRRPGCLESLHSRTELTLRLVPSPLPGEHTGVVRPAGVEQEDVVLTAELAHAGAPLSRSLVIPHPLARGDQEATGPRDAVQEPRLAIERHRRRLVEAAHSFIQLAFAHESPPLEPEPEHLELRDPEHAAQLDCARCEPPRLDRVLV
jgi:hypothetical protein